MSMLIHRCTKCSHPAEWHTGVDCSYRYCPCAAQDADMGPPEVVPTFPVGVPTESVTFHAPGTLPFGDDYFPNRTRTCDCDACQTEYARLTA